MRQIAPLDGPQTHPVRCQGCRNTVSILVSDSYPPCFHYLEQQAQCPELQRRRRSNDDSTLLTMCGALNRSLITQLELTKVEAIVHEGRWVIVSRAANNRDIFYSANQARRQAALWKGCYESIQARNSLTATDVRLIAITTQLAEQLQKAANKVERINRYRSRTIPQLIVRTMALVAVSAIAIFAGAWVAGLLWKYRAAPQAAPSPPYVVVRTKPNPAFSDRLNSKDQQPTSKSTTDPPHDQEITNKFWQMPIAAPGGEKRNTSHYPPGVPMEPPWPQPNEPQMVSLTGGTFTMGSTRDPSEMPPHRVSIKPFEISKFPITTREWNKCVAAKLCDNVATGDEEAPVGNLSWHDAKQYITWLIQTTRKNYRLPSEAEWEYAARAGTQTDYWWGNALQPEMANCNGCSGSYNRLRPAKVGSFIANPFGLHDMGGGVDQWVEDCWHSNYRSAPIDGSAWVEDGCLSHVIRSGSWENDPSYVRAASRDHYDTDIRYPTHGFRVARSP